jgi:hypothetical protein
VRLPVNASLQAATKLHPSHPVHTLRFYFSSIVYANHDDRK